MNRIKFILLALILIKLLVAGDTTQTALRNLEKQLTNTNKDIPVLIQMGKIYHQMAASGQKGDIVKKGEQCFRTVLEYDENNAEALVWLGSLTTIKGRDAWMPWNKLKHVEDGLKLMDQAVRLEKNNPMIRLVRGNNNASLPQFFNRADTAIVDFEFILKLYNKAPDKFSSLDVADIYLMLGDLYMTVGEPEKAIESWRIVTKKFPESKSAENARENLRKLEVHNG